MSLFIKQDENRSELQQRIAAELSEKAKKHATTHHEPMDGVEDTQFVVGSKRTTSLAWVWALIAIAIVIILIVLVASSRH